MRLPRSRIRTLMLAVALSATCLASFRRSQEFGLAMILCLASALVWSLTVASWGESPGRRVTWVRCGSLLLGSMALVACLYLAIGMMVALAMEFFRP